MRKYLYDYIALIDDKIRNHHIDDEVIKEHLIKIQFFQHERLIHLFVTLTYAILLFISLIVSLKVMIFRFISLILMAFLIPYVRHYFKLENGVQYLYKQYDMMRNINEKD